MSSFRRVSRDQPCPICTKADWCLVAEDGSVAICPRVSEKAVRNLGEAGYLHRLGKHRPSRPVITRKLRLLTTSGSCMTLRMAGYQARIAVPEQLNSLSNALGVSIGSLMKLGIGDTGWGCAFPMMDGHGHIIGIRIRKPNGMKKAVAGSRAGLFIPDALGAPKRLLIAEGPTDTAALIDLGFDVVGRPSCRGGVEHLVPLVQRIQPQQTIIVSDGDDPGRIGAVGLATKLRLYVRDVRVIEPPPGIKDAREWKRFGATYQTVTTAIDTANPVTLAFEHIKGA